MWGVGWGMAREGMHFSQSKNARLLNFDIILFLIFSSRSFDLCLGPHSTERSFNSQRSQFYHFSRLSSSAESHRYILSSISVTKKVSKAIDSCWAYFENYAFRRDYEKKAGNRSWGCWVKEQVCYSFSYAAPNVLNSCYDISDYPTFMGLSKIFTAVKIVSCRERDDGRSLRSTCWSTASKQGSYKIPRGGKIPWLSDKT